MKRAEEQAYNIERKLSFKNQGYYRQQCLSAEFDAKVMEAIRQEGMEIFKGNRGNITGINQVQLSNSDEEILNRYNAIHFPHKNSGFNNKIL